MKRNRILVLVLAIVTLTMPVFAQQSDSARSEYIQGSTAFELGNYGEALKHLKRAVRLNPDDAMLNFTLGQTYEKVDSLSQAVAFIQKAIHLKPNDKSFLTELAGIYQAHGKNKEAIQILESAIKLDPHDLAVLYDLARLQSLNHDFAASNRNLNKIENQHGPDLRIYYLKYANFHGLGKRDSVIAQLKGILKLDPVNTSALQALSQYYIDANQPHLAKHILKKALSESPNDPKTADLLTGIYVNEAKWDSVRIILDPVIKDTAVTADQKAILVQDVLTYFNADTTNTHLKNLSGQLLDLFVENDKEDTHALDMAAHFYLQSGINAKATGLLRRSLDRDPQNDDNWFQYIQLLYMSGHYHEAAEQGIRATRYVPGNAFIEFIIGSSFGAMKQTDKSISWLRKATQKPSRDSFKSIVYGALGDSYSAQRKWMPADSAYEQAIHLDPSNDNVLNNYAYYLSTRNTKLEYAREMAQKALQIRPSAPSYLDTMGWIYYKMGHYNEALKYIDKAAKADSSSAEIMEHLGDIYQKLNDHKNAVKWWRMALKKDPGKTYLKKKISSN